ncbi:uncharacterized protein LOC119672634 [Teleopsis dalmanni]|uniref:uncharacterized protein LOC119672634 n=1 Tax=Teleopsis dalmanni TaxID=139649 RepID=UPI0018CE4065|nr:uncharacterized protein LOC119672634 [Teleopsis dalmanni]
MVAPTQHELVNINNSEFNTAASLSDDSGVPLTTNNSISSGGSYRLSTKLEIEVVESDGEVSQFDSLDNCSESGMSAENFNTLKKGPLAPIDPPPEFQDSPQTTLMRSVASNLNYLRRWSSHSSFKHMGNHEDDQISKIFAGTIADNFIAIENDMFKLARENSINDSYARNKHIYSSDSVINNLTDNLYDEPNDVITSLLGNSTDSSSLFPTPTLSRVKIIQTSCPHYQDHTKYFKVIPSKQDNTRTDQKFNVSQLSEINDFDLYYGIKRNMYQHCENTLQRKIICSPLNYSYCHNSHHTGVCTGNRPNSRNSLNSRLSSSHNSLSASSANKPDDSIFITQAMSHDALLSREITDFYNVPIDSDIYALPVDMIYSENERRIHKNGHITFSNKHSKIQQDTNSVQDYIKCHQYKSNRKTNRNKRKKCSEINSQSMKNHNHHKLYSKTKYRDSNEHNDIECDIHNNKQSIQEPLHMSLDEVKKFYHSIYSNTKIPPVTQIDQSKKNLITDSKDTISSLSSIHSGSNLSATKEKIWSRTKLSIDANQKLSSENDKVNNNVNIGKNQYNQQNIRPQNCHLLNFDDTNQLSALQLSSQYNVNNKQTFQREKKSQFSSSLKQKFCSIFRFKKNYNRCRTNNSVSDDNNREQSWVGALTVEDKRNKFQSRALPPLPKKASENLSDYDNKENIKPDIRTFQFTSSIEKVKDYGWYWGPLSSEAAEKVLSNESDGSFIVRDSSDDHYIFSLSFKLNNCVRHVRIEQDQGTFSFGSYAKFKSQTITEFIEKAVEHSRSGRYLFFLHRRPEHGPMRVQLTNPVSRFKHVQSLQHMCRFVILKAVIRKDLIQTLPLPRRLLDYLNYKHCFSEQIEIESSHCQSSEDGFVEGNVDS